MPITPPHLELVRDPQPDLPGVPVVRDLTRQTTAQKEEDADIMALYRHLQKRPLSPEVQKLVDDAPDF